MWGRRMTSMGGLVRLESGEITTINDLDTKGHA